MEPWRLIEQGEASPAYNMAVDEALLREVHAPVLRLYGWNIPAVECLPAYSHRRPIPPLLRLRHRADAGYLGPSAPPGFGGHVFRPSC